MKTLGVLSPTFPPDICGIGDFTANMVSRLAEIPDLKICVISRFREKDSLPDSLHHGPSLKFLPVIKGFGQGLFKETARVIEADKIDTLWIQYNRALYDARIGINLLPGRLKRKFSELKIIATIHDVPLPVAQLDPIFYLTSMFFLKHCDRLIFTTAFDRVKLLPRIFGSGRNSHVIPIGSNIMPDDDALNKDFRAQLGIKPGEKLVLYFGMLRPDKSLLSLVKAVDILQAESQRIHLVLAGRDLGVNYSRYLEARINKEVRREYMHLLKNLPAADVSRLLRQADLIVLPYSDGVSEKRTTFAAALIHGSTIVTTRGKATPPRLYSNPLVILSRSLRAHSLASAIEEGLVYSAKGSGARAMRSELCEFFDWDRIRDEYLEVFNEL
jgi:glycosyltransferase involved in cell wall biosynthesis